MPYLNLRQLETTLNMAYAEDWGELMFNLCALSKASARKQFRHHIKYAFGGLCAYCRENRADSVDHIKPSSVEAVHFEATCSLPVKLATTIKDLSHVGGHGLDAKTFTAR